MHPSLDVGPLSSICLLMLCHSKVWVWQRIKGPRSRLIAPQYYTTLHHHTIPPHITPYISCHTHSAIPTLHHTTPQSYAIPYQIILYPTISYHTLPHIIPHDIPYCTKRYHTTPQQILHKTLPHT